MKNKVSKFKAPNLKESRFDNFRDNFKKLVDNSEVQGLGFSYDKYYLENALAELVPKISSNVWSWKFLSTVIKDQARDLKAQIGSNSISDEQSLSAVREMEKKLDEAVVENQEYFVPVTDFYAPTSPFNMGIIIFEEVTGEDEFSQALLSYFPEAEDDVKWIARIKLTGEQNWCYQEAKRAILFAFSILGLYLLRFNSSLAMPKLIGYNYTGKESVLIRTSAEVKDKFNWTFQGRLIEGRVSWDSFFTEVVLENWKREQSFEKATTLISLLFEPNSGKDKSKFELNQKLYRAIEWFGNGIRANSYSEAFLCYAIALETLLLKENDENLGSITQRLADRVAFLWGIDYPTRKHALTATKRLYKKRSQIVHSGNTALPSDVKELEEYLRICIFRVMEKFDNVTEMQEWFDKWVYG